MAEANPTDIELAQTRTALAQALSQLRTIEQAKNNAVVTAGIATHLAGLDLNPGASEQLTRLLAPEVTCYDQNGQTIPLGPGLQQLGDFVKAKLAAPEYSHFLRGGSVSQPAAGGLPTLPPGAGGLPGQPQQPRNLGEAVAMQAAADQAARKQGNSDPRLDLSSPMGLRRTR